MYKRAVIVLGCGIDAEGNLGDDPKGTVQRGIDAYRQTENTCLIMTGNVSYKATFKPSISEAQAMKDYAIAQGFPANKIFVETESKDSLGNLYFTKQNLLMPLNIHDVSIVRGPNQSTERIDFLAKKVLGPDYTFTVIEPDLQRPNEREREQMSLMLAKQWLDPIEDGDMESIYTLMRARHPAYNSSLSLDDTQQLL